MKRKFLLILLSITILFAADDSVFANLKDEFVEKTLDKNLCIKEYNPPNIVDDFVSESLDNNLRIIKLEINSIYDDFAQNNTAKNRINKKTVSFDEYLPEVDLNSLHKGINQKIDFESQQPVFIHIKENYITKNKNDEGKYIEFVTTNDVKINNKTYNAGTPVSARIETLSSNKIKGIPYDLVIGNFSIDGIPLMGEISKTGANRSLWVCPCVCAFTILFGVGVVFIPIKGGRAKINKRTVYKVYAEN